MVALGLEDFRQLCRLNHLLASLNSVLFIVTFCTCVYDSRVIFISVNIMSLFAVSCLLLDPAFITLVTALLGVIHSETHTGRHDKNLMLMPIYRLHHKCRCKKHAAMMNRIKDASGWV